MLLKLAKLGLIVGASIALLVGLCVDIALLPIRLLINVISMIITYVWVRDEHSMREIIAEDLDSQFTVISVAVSGWKQVFKNIMCLEESIKDDEAK